MVRSLCDNNGVSEAIVTIFRINDFLSLFPNISTIQVKGSIPIEPTYVFHIF